MVGPTVYEAPDPIKSSPDAPRLAIGLPTRKTSPVEFNIHLMQMLHPLNVKMSYIIQKGADTPDGLLPAPARNAILETALKRDIPYVLFFDDDVLFPDIVAYRLWVSMQKHPEAACITGVVPTKIEPVEPLLYRDDYSGAWWDWPLGALIPCHSAGAGCMIVNMEYVKMIPAPWFDDVVVERLEPNGSKGHHKWGQDRWFHMQLREKAGGVVYVDTGLLLAHFDVNMQRPYVMPADAPCYQKTPVGEAFVGYTDDGILMWRRMIPQDYDNRAFVGYLQWIADQETQVAPPRGLVRS